MINRENESKLREEKMSILTMMMRNLREDNKTRREGEVLRDQRIVRSRRSCTMEERLITRQEHSYGKSKQRKKKLVCKQAMRDPTKPGRE